MTNVNNTLSVWEQNAPKCFNDIAFAEDYIKEDLHDYVLHPQLTEYLILEGGYGTGKSTIAAIIAADRLNDAAHCVEINGADWKDDTINKLKGVYSLARLNGEVPILIVNEVDRLKDKQFTFRSFLDAHKGKLLVIMTTNCLSNVDGGIRDRSDIYQIKGFTPEQAVALAQPLLLQNGVALDRARLLQLFTIRLAGEETELSLRGIGRAVDRIVLKNIAAPQQPKRTTKPQLSVV